MRLFYNAARDILTSCSAETSTDFYPNLTCFCQRSLNQTLNLYQLTRQANSTKIAFPLWSCARIYSATSAIKFGVRLRNKRTPLPIQTVTQCLSINYEIASSGYVSFFKILVI
jgi:hypothetical protein